MSSRTRNFDPFSGASRRDFDGYFAGTVGMLTRRTSRVARGVTVSLAGPQLSLFVETRRRVWTPGIDRKRGDSTFTGYDLSIGYAQSTLWLTPNQEGKARGGTAAATYLLDPAIAVSARGSLLASEVGMKGAVYLAAQLGGPAGPLVAAAVAVVGFILFAANAPRS